MPYLPDLLAEIIQREWWLEGRDDQRPPEGDWLVWLLLGGRGAGKTRAGAQWVRGMALGIPPYANAPVGPIALVGETFADVREVMIEGVSGLLSLNESFERPIWQPSRRRLEWPSTGMVAHAFSSEDPEGLRGPQFGAAWADGVGHTASAGPPIPKPGMKITREEAMRILANDLPKYERRVERALGISSPSGSGVPPSSGDSPGSRSGLPPSSVDSPGSRSGVPPSSPLGGVAQAVFDGATSFDFNTGAIHRATWVKDYRAGRLPAARLALLKWTRAGGRVVAGLVRRREAEARLIFEGDYGSLRATAGARGRSDAEAKAYQSTLAALGFYRDAIDGIVGEKTRAAVLAYQRSHSDLVVDGIAGPATLASLSRDMAARSRAVEATGAAITSAIVGGAGAAGAGSASPLLWALAAGAGVATLLAAVIALRYRGEIRRALSLTKG